MIIYTDRASLSKWDRRFLEMAEHVAAKVAYCGHISPDWAASATEAERIFINAGVECLFMFEGA